MMIVSLPSIGCSKSELSTPALCLDLDLLDANIRAMVATCREHDVAWRPHAKCHKSPIIGRWLVDAGACGLTCATVREAELMADTGIRDLLIANLITGTPKIARLVKLAAKADVIVCMDDPAQVALVSQALDAAQRSVRVLVELEIGMHRVGVKDSAGALALARAIHDAPGLELAGVMAYEGHLLTIKDPVEKEQAIHAAIGDTVRTADLLRANGLPCPIVSCGGTGSYPITLKQPGITEIQAGGAIFMDAFYHEACGITDLQHALTILATVNSLPAPDRAVIDAGRKAMSIDIHVPRVVGQPGVSVTGLSAEHGKLLLEGDEYDLQIGQQIELIPGYADLTNVLHPCFYGFRNGKVEREIPIVR